MDRLVDPPGAPEPVGERSPTDGRGPLDTVSTDDVESELYCSAREAGCGYVAIGALGAAPDDGLD
jgi:hypothetical protein